MYNLAWQRCYLVAVGVPVYNQPGEPLTAHRRISLHYVECNLQAVWPWKLAVEALRVLIFGSPKWHANIMSSDF